MPPSDDPRPLASQLADPLLVVGALVAVVLARLGVFDGLSPDAAALLNFGGVTAAVAGGLRWAWERYQARQREAEHKRQLAEESAAMAAVAFAPLVEKLARMLGHDKVGAELVGWVQDLPAPDADDPSRHLLPDGSYTNVMADALAAWYAAAPEDVRQQAQRVDTLRKTQKRPR